jgi:hypothetical protein
VPKTLALDVPFAALSGSPISLDGIGRATRQVVLENLIVSRIYSHFSNGTPAHGQDIVRLKQEPGHEAFTFEHSPRTLLSSVVPVWSRAGVKC